MEIVSAYFTALVNFVKANPKTVAVGFALGLLVAVVL